MMLFLKIAGFTFAVKTKYKYLKNHSTDYIIPSCEADFVIEVTEEEIEAEQTAQYSRGYLESIAVCRKIARLLFSHHTFVLHGVALEVNGEGIVFLARSGVGKTTHANLWKKMFGEKVTVINGDKPFIRQIDGKLSAFGTPWAGKEAEQTNKSCVLRKICFLERGAENRCTELTGDDLLYRVLPFLYTERGTEALDALEMLHASDLTYYALQCNMEDGAALASYRAMFPDEI